MPRARNGKSGGWGTRSVSRLGGWVRWIGCAAVWEAGRAVCGERRLEQTQAYALTATEDDGVGRGNINTYAIGIQSNFPSPATWVRRQLFQLGSGSCSQAQSVAACIRCALESG